MPRDCSRILIEILSVRVERVQDISEEDAKAEGIQKVEPGEIFFDFIGLWNSINEKRGAGWNANPWVWVIEFKRKI